MSRRALRATCDRCGAKFRLKVRERPQRDGGVVQDFSCPKCGHVYPVARITARGVELRRDLRARMAAAEPQERQRILAEYQREVSR